MVHDFPSLYLLTWQMLIKVRGFQLGVTLRLSPKGH